MTLPATDSFTGTDEDPYTGTGWSLQTAMGYLRRIGNQICTRSAGNAECGYRWSDDTFNNDQYCQIALPAFGGASQGATVRASSSGKTFYVFNASGTTKLQFRKCVTGSFTSLGSDISVTLNANDIIKVTVSGTTLEGFLNGVSQGTRTDSDIGSGSAGMIVYWAVDRIDNWEGGNLVTSPTAILSGTATDTIDEADIVAGGKTIIITLDGDTFLST